MSVSYTHFDKSPYRGRANTLPSLGRFALPRSQILAAPLLLDYLYKMHKGPCSPIIGVKEIFKRGNIMGLVHNAVFIHEFSTT